LPILCYYRKQNKIINDLTNRHNVSDFSIVHAHSLFTNGYVAMKLKEFYNIPYIVTVRNTDMNIFFKYMVHLRNTGIKILNNASNIVFLSDSYREKLINAYIPYKIQKDILQKSIVIPNGIDEFWFKNKNTPKTLNIKKMNNTSNIVFLADSYRKKLINTYNPYKIQKDMLQKSIVIPNGIDEFWFKNKNTPKTLNIKKMNLLFVGDINKNKNVETII